MAYQNGLVRLTAAAEVQQFVVSFSEPFDSTPSVKVERTGARGTQTLQYLVTLVELDQFTFQVDNTDGRYSANELEWSAWQ